ncbi:MAG TPA: TIGR01440 family protein [Firmicutes bacterium]|nr:TIGR01440 family protein [Bacillota bacterium]
MKGVSTEKFEHIDEIRAQAKAIFEELMETAELEEGEILVVGCSSSEIASHKIGSWSSEEVGKAIFDTLYAGCRERKIYLAAQCCEHLNRALIIEKEAAKRYHFPMVNVVPQLKAGGSFATAAYYGMEHAVAVEELKAQAGIDIGDTLIGMHLQPVAVPVRTKVNSIGNAHVVCARTRLKYIGGERAAYSPKLRG